MLNRFSYHIKPLLLIAAVLGCGLYWKQYHNPVVNETNVLYIDHPMHGMVKISDPLEIELIKSPAMERLKKIHQYGVTYYAGLPYFFSRYDHCIGVYLLLKKYGLTQKEQIAGLLHDASHTAFSHVAEVVFNHNDHHHSYQDTIHRHYLEQCGIGAILKKYQLTVTDVMHKETDPQISGNGVFKALEQDLPDLCADRIDYILEGSMHEQMLTQEDINGILEALQWNGNSWYFTDPAAAKKFAECSLYLTEHVFGAILNDVTYHWASRAINRAFDIGLFSKEEFCTSVDAAIWQKLETCEDTLISEMLHKIMNWEEYCEAGTPEYFDVHIFSKFRGVNPLILINSELIRLTDFNQEFAELYATVKNRMGAGKYIKFKNPTSFDLGK